MQRGRCPVLTLPPRAQRGDWRQRETNPARRQRESVAASVGAGARKEGSVRVGLGENAGRRAGLGEAAQRSTYRVRIALGGAKPTSGHVRLRKLLNVFCLARTTP